MKGDFSGGAREDRLVILCMRKMGVYVFVFVSVEARV